jgi:hypothetical protein
VPDGTIEAIDRFFDLVDHGVDHVERVLNRGKRTAERHRARKLPRSGAPAPAPTSRKAPTAVTAVTAVTAGTTASTVAIARKPRFYIVEAITPSGITEFVVTDGGNARTTCPSRAFAEQILHALEMTQ